MIVNGIELLQMIKEGKIKSDTEIKVWFDDGLREYVTTLYFTGIDLKWDPGTFLARHFYSQYIEFEIIEEEKEIEKWGKGTLEEIKTKKDYKIKDLQKYIELIMKTQNDIIDEIKKLKEKNGYRFF